MNGPTLIPAPPLPHSPTESRRPPAPPDVGLLLYGLQSPINIGMILRVAETYRARISIFDPHRVLDDAERLVTIKDFACGALERRGFQRLDDVLELERILL